MSDSDEFGEIKCPLNNIFLTIETCITGGLEVTTPYFPRTKAFLGHKLNNRGATSTEAGPSNHSRAQPVAFGSRQNQVHEIDDEDDEVDIQEVEARTIPTRGGNNKNGKRKEAHAVVENQDDEIQEVDPPPPKKTRSRGGSRKPKLGFTKTPAKPAQEAMEVDLNDGVEHDMDMGVNGAAAVADTINAAIEHNAGRTLKSGGKQNEDGRITRLEEELRQVRFKGNYRPLLVVSY